MDLGAVCLHKLSIWGFCGMHIVNFARSLALVRWGIQCSGWTQALVWEGGRLVHHLCDCSCARCCRASAAAKANGHFWSNELEFLKNCRIFLQISCSSILFLATAGVCNHQNTGHREFYTLPFLWILQLNRGWDFGFGISGAVEQNEWEALI